MSNWSDNPELVAATGSSGSSSSSLQSLQSGGPVDIPKAPEAPNIQELQGMFNKIPGLFNARKIGNAYDSEIATTEAQGFGAASNAGKSYAARESQMGVSPVSAGAVEAAARAPTYAATGQLTKDKEAAKMEAHKEAAGLQTEIAKAIGGIRESYTKTLADYNLGAAGLKEKAGEFSRGLAQNQSQFDASGQFDLAKLLGASPGGGSTDFVKWLMGQLGIGKAGTPGYVGTNGPLEQATGALNFNNHNAAVGVI